jgi:hypothetical protein
VSTSIIEPCEGGVLTIRTARVAAAFDELAAVI